MPNTKPQLRKHFLKIRKDILPLEANLAAIKAADNFLKTINLYKVRTIAFYHPISGEISPLPLLDKIISRAKLPFREALRIWIKNRRFFKPLPKFTLRKNSIIFSLPTIINKESHLLFHPWSPGDKLQNNALYPHIQEAEIQKSPIIPDIILVPLVAFDENCQRLGYGGGFYDKTIAKLRENGKGERGKQGKKTFPSPLLIGYAYECQKSDTPLPTEQHDIQLDFIVTDKNVYSIS